MTSALPTRARPGRPHRTGAEAHASEMPPYDPERLLGRDVRGAGRRCARTTPRSRGSSPRSARPTWRGASGRPTTRSRRAGITFAVNQGAEGIEKIMPFDLVPRMITPDEWRQIERGLEQRVRALNLFLHDVYHEQRILAQRRGPAGAGAGRAAATGASSAGVDVPLGVYTHIVGSDLVRDASGAFFVLEDNLRTPSGVSYVVENRRVLKRVWPQIFRRRTTSARSRATRRTCSRCCARSRRRSSTSRPWCCSRRASTTRPTSSTPSWPRRWASSWCGAPTCSSTTRRSSCARRGAGSRWT